ncbi:MAG TPA: proline dehydrogenase family protein [Phycisphaerales bacterium]|nr:proline dehydrogenase family protein [Phycisphaerales bacterium]
MALFARSPKKTQALRVGAPPGGAGASDGEPLIREIGRDLLARARRHRAGLLSAKFYSDALMSWSMKDPAFKVQMFRFVDAFPMLRTPEEVYDHLRDYLDQPGVTVPGVIEAALKLGSVAKGMAAAQIGRQITGMAGKFIAGADAAGALPTLRDLWKDGIGFSVDLLGEACVSEEEADAYQHKYLDLIENLPEAVASFPGTPRLESDHLGAIPRTNVSIKVSSLSARCDPIDTEGSIRDLMRRLGPVLRAAGRRGVFVNFDMEQFALKDLTIELFERCCAEFEFEGGLALQAYLTSAEADARRLAEWAARTGRCVTVRLVKGAYWDYQVIHAEQTGWPCPVWTSKRQTDACFERVADILLDATPRAPGTPGLKLALGSHNARSIAHALAGVRRRGLPDAALELQMLHGMADQLKHAAREMDLRVREYVPVGQMIPGMAYLVRRLLENTSNESWLRAGFGENADPDLLLASPHETAPPRAGHAPGANGHPAPPSTGRGDGSLSTPERHALSPAVPGLGDGRPFLNEPMRDFSQAEIRRAFAAAVAGATVPAIASDRTPAQASEMLGACVRAYPAWRDTPALVRARVLVRAAALMRQRRDELAGVMIKEAGKTWREADADVCEAIDFCEFYARLAPGLFAPRRLGRFIGELDEAWHQPRGVAVVIAPWNFPQAILCGMTVAALVTGNPVLVKPAEQTAGIAHALVGLLRQALLAEGVPPELARDVLQFCPAPGHTTGAALVRDPRVALIAFTGSKEVGLDIIKAAGVTGEAQEHVRRVICEMGGKNAVIVDTSADLDEAVLGVRHSAFGFQGQKCSACSRLIVVDPQGPEGPALRHVIARLVGATRALVIGDPSRPGTDIGPVIDLEAAGKIRAYVARAKAESCRLELEMEVPETDPFVAAHRARFVGPTIFSGVRPHHAIAVDEIFGPVLAVMHAPSFEAALDLANASPYKLTGGVFSRKPANLALARERFRVGNLYLNRGITGALVARQPFGGFGLSGLGSKAGGEDYLRHFVDPRASCENTLRRGFAPEL